MFSSKDLFFTPPTSGYQIAKSLRFRQSATAYLNRTPGSSPTDAKKFSFSWWTKKAKIATANQFVYGCGSSGSDETYFGFNSTDKFEYLEYTSSAYQINLSTTPVYRDPSAWYHCLLVLDTTQSTSTDRVKFFVNGVQQTLTGTFPSLNYATSNVNSTDAQNINRLPTSGAVNFDGYYAEVYMIDGQAKTTTDFGFYDTNNIWQPKAYSGTYGTNGFYLKFTDVGATSGSNAGYGKDFSTNTNYWTTNNLSSTSGATYDSMLDSPTNYYDGTASGRGNYATLNPIYIRSGNNCTASDGNLKLTGPTTAGVRRLATMGSSATKFYFEWQTNNASSTANEIFIADANDSVTISVADSDLGGFATTDIGMVACDPTTGNVWFGRNGTWYRNATTTTTGNPATTAVAYGTLSGYPTPYFPAASSYNSSYSLVVNFGQRPFTYDPPPGFFPLNTQNLTLPTIFNGAQYMAAVTYTGTGSPQTITTSSTNSGNNFNAITFQPDLVWIKDRTNAQDNKLTDAVRGATKALISNTTADETTDANGVTAFNVNGFSVGTGTRAYSDSNGDSYIAWEWKESVSSGFDIVTYTGNGSARTISHSLNAVPNMIIVKARTTASTDQGWPVYHSANTSAPETDYMLLNTTDATADLDTVWNDTAPTSTVFSVGTNANVNANNDTYVAYLWAAITGYSAFGSYTGNGSTDGPFVYTGFRPRWMIVKRNSSSGSSWVVYDTTRATYNVAGIYLQTNAADAEVSSSDFDFLSNSFKIRTAGGYLNNSGATYLYAAFAENPFTISRAR